MFLEVAPASELSGLAVFVYCVQVYKVTGYDRICRRYGAEPVYLDEGPTVEVALRDETWARISRRLYEEIILRSDNPSTGPSTSSGRGPSTGSGRSRGGWTLVCGSGFEEGNGDKEHRLDGLPGDILIVGPCACEEVGDRLARRYPDRRLYRVEAHNDLMSNMRYQARLMGVTPVAMVPLNPLSAALTVLQAKLHGLTARVPPLLG